MRGRKPVPTSLKILRGNPGKRAFNQEEATAEAASLEPPADLVGVALTEWKRLAPMLSTAGLLTVLDRDKLKQLCIAYERLATADDKVRTLGLIVAGAGGVPIQNPYWRAAKDLNRQISAALIEFGMTPSSRSRVAAVKTKTAPLDRQHEKYFGGSRG
jgi:P27 family predicted phage terminase small subunit